MQLKKYTLNDKKSFTLFSIAKPFSKSNSLLEESANVEHKPSPFFNLNKVNLIRKNIYLLLLRNNINKITIWLTQNFIIILMEVLIIYSLKKNCTFFEKIIYNLMFFRFYQKIFHQRQNIHFQKNSSCIFQFSQLTISSN